MSKQSNKNNLFVVLSLLFMCLVLGISAYAYQRHMHTVFLIQQEREAAALKAKEEKAKKRRDEIQALFDAYLNAFKNELFKKAKTYKKTRKLLKNLIRPINYTDIESAKENYLFFKEDLAPSLRSQTNEIIGVFEQYSDKIEGELGGNESNLQQTFLSQWKNMVNGQLANYVDFFANEEKLIQAYDELITFYYTHSKRYVIDDSGDSFEFHNPNDAQKAQFLLEQIEDLQKSAR